MIASMQRGAQLPNLDTICDRLAAIIHGIDAEALTRTVSDEAAAAGGVLVKLPVWAALVPKIPMGKKGLQSDGTTKPMPVRIEWEGGSVRFLPFGSTTHISWRLVGLGHDGVGISAVSTSGDGGVHVLSPVPGSVSPEREAIRNVRVYAGRLRAVIAEGRSARWNLISSMEAYTRNRLTIANHAIAYELRGDAENGASSVLDDISLDELVSELLYGTNGSSVVIRMVDRALQPEQFRKVDPLRYIATTLRARSEEAIRRKIGDPKVGPKVRRIMASSGATTLDELLAAYREAYPNDALASKRAIAALTAGPELSAHQALFATTLREQRGML